MASGPQDPLLAAKAAALAALHQSVSVPAGTAGGKAPQAQEEGEPSEPAALWSPGAAASLASDLPQPLFPDEVYDASLATPGPHGGGGGAAAGAPAPAVQPEPQPVPQPGPDPAAAHDGQPAAEQQGPLDGSEAPMEVEQPAAGTEAAAAAAAIPPGQPDAGGPAEGDLAAPTAQAAAHGQGSADAATSDEAGGAAAAEDGAASGGAGADGAAGTAAAQPGEAGGAPAPPPAPQGQGTAQPSPATQAAHAAAAQQYAAAYYGGGYGDPSAAAWAAYGYGAAGYYGSGYDYGAGYYGSYSGGPCAAVPAIHSCAACSPYTEPALPLLGLPSSARLLVRAPRWPAPARVALGAGLRRCSHPTPPQ